MTTIAKLNALVLAGGQSARMGVDKGLLEYHGQPQRLFIYNLLRAHCDMVYMSIRPDQQEEFSSDVDCIVDQNKYPGPFNGIMSAHLLYPAHAWLVVACDMPLINRKAITRLIAKRNPSSDATAYKAKDKTIPEPLFCIWEPRGLMAAHDYLENGISNSPVKFLASSCLEIVKPLRDDVLVNINHQDHYRNLVKSIKEKNCND
ncbi:molybdenum cofactor guanylyltransferase [Galbibacter sp.]|uniref:molybdenum cofactor guanylyltransferase n=1 Tax=Galbibacter sp. TaxID=2918471 RepID=UPI002D1178E2|nr:molybdenum cofactor guanylyltransferase [Galbibacter sp.]HLV62615.1 molybdenum cofactor guanylyltransferase [Galbibacter sp.]